MLDLHTKWVNYATRQSASCTLPTTFSSISPPYLLVSAHTSRAYRRLAVALRIASLAVSQPSRQLAALSSEYSYFSPSLGAHQLPGSLHESSDQLTACVR